jgi:pyruvate dehydrogenase E2 component (dihydrolipoamide acetyltransferase)
MPHRFHLPDIGEGLEEAEVVEWLVAPGEVVVRDQPLVEVLTDKASSELPSPVAGTILRLGASEGERIRVGALLIEIDDGSVDGATGALDPEMPPVDEGVATADPPTPDRPTTGRAKAAPATRRLAIESGVDLATVTGSGPGGRITTDNVRAAAAADRTTTAAGATAPPAPTAPPIRPDLGQMPVGRHPLRGIRGVVARNMAASWSEIPHIHTMDELDASLLVDFRNRMRSMGRPGAELVTHLSVAAVAAARALRRFPMVNGHVEGHPGEDIVIPESVNLGIAVATDSGLMVPVVADADRLDLFTMSSAIARVADRARQGDLSASDLSGATFTITNYGSLGGRFATPIIPPGQGAILGLGAVAERPIVVDGAVVARPTLPVVLGADHRLIDGDLAEAFRRSIVDDLSEPLHLLMGS